MPSAAGQPSREFDPAPLKAHKAVKSSFGLADLVLLLGSLLVCAAIGEIGLRMAGKKFNGSTYTADPLLGWALRPGAAAWETAEGVAWSRINSHGFRDHERPVAKPAGTYRIAVVGDSFTEARQVGLDDAFTSQTERALNQDPACCGNRRAEVLNFGVPGYGTAQELLLLKNRVWQFSPDLIVLQTYTGNDLFDNHRSLSLANIDQTPYFLLRDGKLVFDDSFRHLPKFSPARIRIKNIASDLMNNSILLQTVLHVRTVLAQRNKINAVHQRGTLPPNYQQFLAFLPPELPEMKESWQVTEALLEEFIQEVRSHGVPVLFLIMPSPQQFDPDETKRARTSARHKIDSLEYADDRVENFAKLRQVPTVRLIQTFLDENRRTGKYLAGFPNTGPQNGHLNEFGHTVVARELSKAVRKLSSGN